MYEALSSKTVVAPRLSSLSVVIKLMIKEMNSETCAVGALHAPFLDHFLVIP